jgi:hypothetical protein
MTDRPPRRRRVYVAGPMSQGDVWDHVRRAIDVAEALLALGYAPFVPHLSWTWHERYPHDLARAGRRVAAPLRRRRAPARPVGGGRPRGCGGAARGHSGLRERRGARGRE